MIGYSIINYAKGRSRNLICCKSINSVLPPSYNFNKFSPINLIYSSPSQIDLDFYSTNSDYMGIQFNVGLSINNSLSSEADMCKIIDQ